MVDYRLLVACTVLSFPCGYHKLYIIIIIDILTFLE